jgi:zinc transport system substrate-binding protein
MRFFPTRIFPLALLAAAVLTAGVLFSCFATKEAAGSGDRLPDTDRPLVVVSIPPQAFFVERIAAGRVRSLTLIEPGQNSHSYEPAPRQMAELSGAAVWLLSGAEFEIALWPRIAALFPDLPIIDGTEGARFRPLEEHDEEDGEPAHSETEIDRHLWLGREGALVMADHILAALRALDAASLSFYRENHAALVADINAEFDRLKTELAPLRGKTVFVYHPAFGYFLDEFGIVQRAVETGGKEPGPRTLNRLIDEARTAGATAIFVQVQFPVQAAQTVAGAVGARVVPLDPLAQDWLANIRAMGAALVLSAAVPEGAVSEPP